MNITYHLRSGGNVEVVNVDRHAVSVSVRHIIDDPTGKTTINGRFSRQPALLLDNHDVARIEIDLGA